MTRPLKWIASAVLILLAIPVVTIIGVLTLANTDPGRRLIETGTASLTGGMVRIDGLAGRFPDALAIRQIQVSDAKGPYVTIGGLVLDWSPLHLVRRTVLIGLLRAGRLTFDRLPEPDGQSAGGGTAFGLPVRVDLRRLLIDRASIGASVAGQAATLTVDGAATLRSLTEGAVRLDVERLDMQGHYAIDAHIAKDDITATIDVKEPAKGLIATIAHLPGLGAVAVQASIGGPGDSLATTAAIAAGSLTASATGTVDLTHRAANLTVKARSAAMEPVAGVSWRSVLLDATVRGPFAGLDANATLTIGSLSAGGARIGTLVAVVTSQAGDIGLHGTATDLQLPGPKPDLFAAAPVAMDATVRLNAPGRPATFALHHPLLVAGGTATTANIQQARMHLTLPDLSPLAAAGGVNIAGKADLDLRAAVKDGTATVSATGHLAIAGGMDPVPALIGDDATIDLAASMSGEDVTLSHLAVNGKALAVSAQGSVANRVIAAAWTVALPDLTAIQPVLSGTLHANGRVDGALDNLAVHAGIGADLAAKTYPSGHMDATVDATGLPALPHVTVTAAGRLLNAPLSLALTAGKTGDAFKITLAEAAWKSLTMAGTASLTPPAGLPTGTLHVNVGRLADLEPFLGRPIAGQLSADLNSDDQAAKVALTVRDAALPGTATAGKVLLNAIVTDPAGHPTLDGTFSAAGVSAGSTQSISAMVTAHGPSGAIAVTVAADAPAVAGGAAKVATAALLDAGNRTMLLTRLEASWKQQVLRLSGPAKFAFASGVTVDRLRLASGQAVLAVSGRAGSTLDLTATLGNLPADIGAIADPAFAADGVIAADARLTGTAARPEGTVKLTATGVRQRHGPGRALPPANLTATAELAGTSVRVDTRLTAGPSHLSVTGSAPLSRLGALALTADGHVDLAMLDPILTAQGRRVRGEVDLNASMTGTASAPLVSGTARLAHGSATDYAHGVQIGAIAATIQATGDTVRLTRFSAKAGPGTLAGSGSVSLAGTMPADLRFTAENARAVSSDLVSALIDANLTVQGAIEGDMQVAGTVHVRRADIRIPDKLPSSVAVLAVRDANTPPPQPTPPQPASPIALNVTLDAPEQVFIRGQGLNAELGGIVHFRGTTMQPNPDGGLHLRQGTLSIVGTTLNFTEGTIGFSGAGLADPSIHFVATSTTPAMIATLTVTGSASHPKIVLSSIPELPQDEILAQLLFNTGTSKLSPFQLAEVASALASLSGATSGFDPLGRIRTSLGLDRLSVGSDLNGNPAIQGGRYVSKRVYVGAQQSATGGTQATIQIDLAKGLKLQSTAGSGSVSATGSASNADAASVGITYQFDY